MSVLSVCSVSSNEKSSGGSSSSRALNYPSFFCERLKSVLEFVVGPGHPGRASRYKSQYRCVSAAASSHKP